MNRDIKRKKLRQLFEDLKALHFPKFSSNDEISNWIEELIEIDAYYAGLALSVAEGEKVVKYDLYDLVKMRKELELIQLKNKVNGGENLKIILECYKYLDKIQEIDSILKEL